MSTETSRRNDEGSNPIKTLGSVRLHREGKKENFLMPEPSANPNDPLNW
jgi:hypothetical protein